MGSIGDNGQADKITTAKKMAYNMQSEEKRLRKQALLDLKKFLSEESLTFEDHHHIFNEIHMYTLNGIRDKCEPVREEAIKFAQFFILEKLQINDYYLSYVFPILLERLGSCEIIEESEEIRFQLLLFLEAIILRYSHLNLLKDCDQPKGFDQSKGLDQSKDLVQIQPSDKSKSLDHLNPFLSDMTTILSETVKDKYPAIKELSCKCIVLLARALPKNFHQKSETLIKPVLTAFGHQRFKTRVEAVKCVGELVMHSTYKGLEDAVVPMAERLFDQIPVVRRTVAQVVTRWMLEYRDRYSFFQKLLPLILTGLIDEVPDTRMEAHQLWESVGKQYEKENEEDLRDQINFLNVMPKYYTEGLSRPILGCRVLVQRNVGKIISALSNELMSWQPDVRIRCSQLLCVVVLHAENGVTQHLQGILPAMYSAARDEDNRVVENIAKASELMGFFVSYDTWKKLLLPAIEDGPHYGHLIVLAGLIRGSPKQYIAENLGEITQLLSDTAICWSRKARYQREMISCVRAIVSKLDSSVEELVSKELAISNSIEMESTNSKLHSGKIGLNLFIIIISVVSLRDKDNMDIGVSLLDDVSKALPFSSTKELWSNSLGGLLTIISRDPQAWTAVTAERCIFETVLLESGEAFGENLAAISDILVKALDPKGDPESRLKTFIALSTAFKSKEIIFKNSDNLPEFLERLVEDVFVPSLVWQAGATSEAMRTMAASCLLNALNPIESLDLQNNAFKSENLQSVDLFTSPDILRNLWDKLLPLLVSLAEDSSSKSRALALENLIALKDILVSKSAWDIEDVVKVYPEILKRLDDPTDFVRICAIKALRYVFENCPEDFKSVTYKAHHELLLDTLLTHFDDDDERFQENAFSVFEVLSGVCKELLVEKVNKHRLVLRNQSGCDRIIENLL